jgi:hypothetical protein
VLQIALVYIMSYYDDWINDWEYEYLSKSAMYVNIDRIKLTLQIISGTLGLVCGVHLRVLLEMSWTTLVPEGWIGAARVVVASALLQLYSWCRLDYRAPEWCVPKGSRSTRIGLGVTQGRCRPSWTSNSGKPSHGC